MAKITLNNTNSRCPYCEAEDCNLVQWENFLTQLDNEKSNKRKLFVFAEVDIINRFPELTRSL